MNAIRALLAFAVLMIFVGPAQSGQCETVASIAAHVHTNIPAAQIRVLEGVDAGRFIGMVNAMPPEEHIRAERVAIFTGPVASAALYFVGECAIGFSPLSNSVVMEFLAKIDKGI